MKNKADNPLYTLTNTLYFVAFLCGLIVLYWGHFLIVDNHKNDLRLKASESVVIYQDDLNDELTRFSFLPYVVARDENLIK